jgi:nucleoside phosphorylase
MLHFTNPDAIRALVSADEIVTWLADVPISDAALVGVTAFHGCPFLSDADCRSWLVDLFTRSQYKHLDQSSTAAIGDLLAERDFPKSAVVVRRTVEQFKRSDVAPIHNQIRYKYQMARAYTREPDATRSRLPKVLIATALPLEREEVVKHLSTTYDANLLADVALWPAANPVFEVYVTTTGPGNLTAQGAVLRTLEVGVRPALAFFVGVCGGVKDSDIADVVYSTKVYYYEGGKEEDGGVRARPMLKETSEDLVQLAHRVATTPWQPRDNGGHPRAPRSTQAVFASGELVLTSTDASADNYQRIKADYNDVQVVDMEAFGFLKAMQDSGIKFSMVIRGVSDKIAGKVVSDAQNNQPTAARNAAAFLFALLRDCPLVLAPKKAKKNKGFFERLLGNDDDED